MLEKEMVMANLDEIQRAKAPMTSKWQAISSIH